MINNHVATVFGVLVVLAALGASANAEPIPGPSTPAEFGAKLLVCNACHGADGAPKSAATPVLWGQQESYLVKQLHDFQSGDRKFEVMTWMATTLSPTELPSVAANPFLKSLTISVSLSCASSGNFLVSRMPA